MAPVSKTENAALASDASPIASELVRYCKTKVVLTSVASVHCMSSEEMKLVDKFKLKPEEGIEPSKRKMTTLILHQASGYPQFYHEQLF